MTGTGTGTGNNDIETGYINDIANGETTPLLSASPSATSLEIARHDIQEPYLTVAGQETEWIITKSSLSILTLMLESSFIFVNGMSVSHLGANELAAMALSGTCTGVFALGPVFGLLSAMDTYCSTAFTASREKTLVGFHFQRGLISVFAHLLVIAPILWYSEDIFLLIRQDPEIARLSGMYLRIQILAVLPFSLFEATKRFLQAQGIMRAGTIVLVVVAPIHWISNFFLVRSPTYGVGFIGAPIANVISNYMMFGGILLYTYNSKAAEAWGGWTKSAFQDMKEYYRLAIPAVVTVCAEWIGFELMTIGASYFGAYQLAGQSIIFNSMFIVFQISSGLGYSASPRIGNLIGAAKPRQARIAADVSLIASVLIGSTGTLILLIWGDWWISVYTTDPLVAIEADKLIPVGCLFLINDGLNAILGAILRGLGRQKVSANAYIIGFYCCAMPLSLYLGYYLHMETVGLWWGLSIGVILTSLIQILYIYMAVDWKNEVRLCLLRLKNKDKEDVSSNEGVPGERAGNASALTLSSEGSENHQ